MLPIFRVVLDTNYLMSAMLSSRGASAKLIDWLTRDEEYFQLLVSQSIWDEYRTVANWLIPHTRQREKARILQVLLSQSEHVLPAINLTICPDPSDNRFLECAVAGHADYLVTKNIRHFPRGEFAGVKIVRIGAFLERLENAEQSRRRPGQYAIRVRLE